MAHTIFILGTDPQQCKELREILQERVSDDIVTAHTENNLSNIKESDTVIITSEEKNPGILLLYRRLLHKLEEQVHRAELLSDLIRLFSSSVQMDELLDRVVSKSLMYWATRRSLFYRVMRARFGWSPLFQRTPAGS